MTEVVKMELDVVRIPEPPFGPLAIAGLIDLYAQRKMSLLDEDSCLPLVHDGAPALRPLVACAAILSMLHGVALQQPDLPVSRALRSAEREVRRMHPHLFGG